MRNSLASRSRSGGALAAITVLAGLLAACGAAGGASARDTIDDMEPVEISLAALGPEEDRTAIGMKAWQDAVTERTDGKVTFKNYWSSSLLGVPDMLSGVSAGAADMGVFLPSFYPQELPVNAWAEGFGSAVSESSIHDVAAGGAAALEFLLTDQSSIEEYAEQNLKLIDVVATPAYNMLCNVPMESESDASGKRARSSGPMWTSTLEALSMVAVDVPINESYEALQRGVIDCVSLLPSGFTSFGLQEVAKEYVPVSLAQSFISVGMNLDTWNEFPEEVQQIMHEEAGAAARAMWDATLKEQAAFGELLEDGTLNVNDPSALAPVVNAERERWLDDMVDTAPDGVDDPQGVVDNYLERRKYWTDALVALGYDIETADPDALRESMTAVGDVDLTEFYDQFNEEVIAETAP